MNFNKNTDTFRARRITNAAEVLKVLDSPRCSFYELMDCVRVAKQENNWALRHRSAERMFSLATQSIKYKDVESAAIELVKSSVRIATDLDDLKPSLNKIKSRFEAWTPTTPTTRTIRVQQIEEINQILLLMNDDHVNSQIRLSSKLRRLDRPDLSVVVAQRAVTKEPKNCAGLITFAAGLADLNQLISAMRNVDKALQLNPRDHVALVEASRIKQLLGKWKESLHYAKNAFAIEINKFTVYRLLAAAAKAEDRAAFMEARQLVREGLEKFKNADPWYLLLAIQVLIEVGRLVEAEAALDDIENTSEIEHLKPQVSKLKRELKIAVKEQQQELFN